MAISRPYDRRECRTRTLTARIALLSAALAMPALGIQCSTLNADDSLADSTQTSSGKPLVFRSVLSRPTPDDAANQPTEEPDGLRGGGFDDANIAPVAKFDDPSQQHFGTSQAGGFAPPRLLGNNPSAHGGDPFWPVHLASAEEEVPSTEVESVPRPMQAPLSASEIGPPNDTSPNFLPPNGAPAGPPPPGAFQGAPGGDWPHGDLRTQFGEPLVGASWNNRPYQVGTFLGFMRATELIRGEVNQNTGVIGGFRLGWDYDTYWGIEGRLAFASIQTETEASPVFDSDNQATYWDTSLLYYPWGDSRWRPYLTIGMGLTNFTFFDESMGKHSRGLVGVPIGGGLKYWMHDSWILRFDVLDNVQIGSSGLNTMNNFSFTSGVEYRFGGSHKSYWPWDPAGY